MKTSAILLLLYCLLQTGFAQTVTYTADPSVISNPDRGFYHHTETHSTGYTLLNGTTLQNYKNNEGITLILRVFYLENFLSSNISAAYLNNMMTDFNTIRNAGLKCIVRFAYTNQTIGWPPVAPYGDATKAQMILHIEQLKPILKANADVITLIQAGFIGIWGEWYYTTHFGDPAIAGRPNAADYVNRKEIVDSLFKSITPAVMVAVRTPNYKLNMLSLTTANPITVAEAYSGSSKARMAHHNDCFLASAYDYGTYQDSTSEKIYLAEETKYTVMGGETCNDDPLFTNCTFAVHEMYRMHWSYINTDYHPDVLSRWNANGCLTTVKKNLGYRLEMLNGTYSYDVSSRTLTTQIQIKNTGWASVYLPKSLSLVIRDNTSKAKFFLEISGEEIRKWLPGQTITLNHSFVLNGSVPDGQYQLMLKISDTASTLKNRKDYFIRCANQNTWEDSTNYNKLNYQFTVMTSLGFHSPGNNSTIFSELNIYPNPAGERMTIQLPSDKLQEYIIRVYNVNGILLQEYTTEKDMVLNRYDFPTEKVLLIKISDETGNYATRWVVLE